jgi:hypothetical protein
MVIGCRIWTYHTEQTVRRREKQRGWVSGSVRLRARAGNTRTERQEIKIEDQNQETLEHFNEASAFSNPSTRSEPSATVSRKVAIAIGAVLALLVTLTIVIPIAIMGAPGQKTPPAPATFTVSFSITIKDGYPGYGGYSDIRTGSQAEVMNQRNEVLGVGTLSCYSSTCAAQIIGIPSGQALYGAHTGKKARGIIWQKETEARSFALTFGY